MVESLPRLVPGAAVGPYRVANVPGEGSVGEAIEAGSQRRVALRRLPASIATAPERMERLRQCLKSVADWKHPHVLPVYGMETHEGGAYLVMEFAGRGSLADQAAFLGRLPWHEATRRLIETAQTIELAHSRGVIHGNIRPSSLLLSGDGALKVAGFGLPPLDSTADAYAAPELLSGGQATPACDVYSLGATYLALLTGRPPSDGAAPPSSPGQSAPSMRMAGDVPLRCEIIVRRAMAPKPADRYPSVREFRSDLEVLLRADQSPPKPAPPPRLPRGLRNPKHLAATWLPRLAVLALIGVMAYMSLPVFRTPKTAKKSAAEPPPTIDLPKLTNSIGMAFVQAPAGTFTMGDRLVADAQPHMVRITRPFYIGVQEVTQREYRMVMGTNPSVFRGDEYPVDNVSWLNAREFCEKLSQREAESTVRRSYRLPTEAEWEFACRAGTTTPFSCGTRLGALQANCLAAGFGRAMPGGHAPANPWGLRDMHGNVWEWCADWYKADYYLESPIDDPQGPTTGAVRVLRGGAWSSLPEDCASAHRGDRFKPEDRGADVGFRVICVVPEREMPDADLK